MAPKVATAADQMSAWLRDLPRWPAHPTNASGTVAAHAGPTVLSEHDCVLHFARFLAAAGVPWEDLHLELSPGQWLFEAAPGGALPRRIDLAVIPRQALVETPLPVAVGDFVLDAVFEFAHASNHWQFGAGSPARMLEKVATDIVKTAGYLQQGIAERGYVVIVEECDHGFAEDLVRVAADKHGVEVLLLQAWR